MISTQSPVVSAAQNPLTRPDDASYGVAMSSVIRASYSSGKVIVPVSGSTLYAGFKHFTAVPAGPGGQGYSIAQLQVMDILADSLADLRSQIHGGGLDQLAGGTSQPVLAATRPSSSAVHRLMVEYSATLQTVLAASRERHYAPIIPPDTGTALTLSVSA